MIAASLRSVTLGAVIAAALVAFGCADKDGGQETPAGTSSSTASTTPAATAVPFDDERITEILDHPGLLSFLSDLDEAVEANDVQFLIDHTHFAEYECQNTGGFPAEPEECHGAPGRTLLASSYGTWQSEGGYWSEAAYEAAISDMLTGSQAEDARMYAIGQLRFGDDESTDVADVMVTGLGGDSGLLLVEGTAMSLAIAERGGEWAITRFSRARTELVPGFYNWWIEWDDFIAVTLRAS